MKVEVGTHHLRVARQIPESEPSINWRLWPEFDYDAAATPKLQ